MGKAQLQRTHRAAGNTRAKQSLRVWLRLLACEGLVENSVRSRMRKEFSITLPQFDVLAELEHMAQPLNMTELSTQLMVSNGNVTGVVDRLVREGYVQRTTSPDDRRAQLIELTGKGLRTFQALATQHEAWISNLFSGLSGADMDELLSLLNKTHEILNRNHLSPVK